MKNSQVQALSRLQWKAIFGDSPTETRTLGKTIRKMMPLWMVLYALVATYMDAGSSSFHDEVVLDGFRYMPFRASIGLTSLVLGSMILRGCKAATCAFKSQELDALPVSERSLFLARSKTIRRFGLWIGVIYATMLGLTHHFQEAGLPWYEIVALLLVCVIAPLYVVYALLSATLLDHPERQHLREVSILLLVLGVASGFPFRAGGLTDDFFGFALSDAQLLYLPAHPTPELHCSRVLAARRSPAPSRGWLLHLIRALRFRLVRRSSSGCQGHR